MVLQKFILLIILILLFYLNQYFMVLFQIELKLFPIYPTIFKTFIRFNITINPIISCSITILLNWLNYDFFFLNFGEIQLNFFQLLLKVSKVIWNVNFHESWWSRRTRGASVISISIFRLQNDFLFEMLTL